MIVVCLSVVFGALCIQYDSSQLKEFPPSETQIPFQITPHFVVAVLLNCFDFDHKIEVQYCMNSVKLLIRRGLFKYSNRFDVLKK